MLPDCCCCCFNRSSVFLLERSYIGKSQTHLRGLSPQTWAGSSHPPLSTLSLSLSLSLLYALSTQYGRPSHTVRRAPTANGNTWAAAFKAKSTMAGRVVPKKLTLNHKISWSQMFTIAIESYQYMLKRAKSSKPSKNKTKKRRQAGNIRARLSTTTKVNHTNKHPELCPWTYLHIYVQVILASNY